MRWPSTPYHLTASHAGHLLWMSATTPLSVVVVALHRSLDDPSNRAAGPPTTRSPSVATNIGTSTDDYSTNHDTRVPSHQDPNIVTSTVHCTPLPIWLAWVSPLRPKFGAALPSRDDDTFRLASPSLRLKVSYLQQMTTGLFFVTLQTLRLPPPLPEPWYTVLYG